MDRLQGLGVIARYTVQPDHARLGQPPSSSCASRAPPRRGGDERLRGPPLCGGPFGYRFSL